VVDAFLGMINIDLLLLLPLSCKALIAFSLMHTSYPYKEDIIARNPFLVLLPSMRPVEPLTSHERTKWGTCPSSTRERHNTPGAAAAQRDTEKRAQYRQEEWGAYRFTPLSVETFGRLDTPMMHLLSDLRNLAVSCGDGLFTKEQFVSRVLQELSISLCNTNAHLEHGVSGFFVRASRVCIRHGRSGPSAEVSEWD
jgi:hypothetical protein